DIIVVPLRPNAHVSGITVMLEAAAVGKPMIATNVGGLQDYFTPQQAAWVPPCDPEALRQAADRLAASPDEALHQARAAARQIVSRNLTTEQFAQQHVRITRDLLAQRASARGSSVDAVRAHAAGMATGSAPSAPPQRQAGGGR
ncbi:MAG TPA: glycosyltransferase, partial [Paraburkholderia sp.]|nr:glycosyltransferase [Paraburkholderia sp.]